MRLSAAVRAWISPVLALGLGIALPGIGSALSVVTTNNANTLANTVLGPGVALVGAPTYVGGATASGTFTGGVTSGLGINSGVVLTTGLASSADGPNTSPLENGGNFDGIPDANTNLGTAGDAALSGLVGGTPTFDAASLSLSFQFTGGGPGNLFVSFAFASEEYIDFIGAGFDDVFAFFLDGANIALVPSTTNRVSVDSINPVTNSAYYVNNVANGNGLPNAFADIRYDGFTTLIMAQAIGLAPGVHNMRFAIADTGDQLYDSAVFIGMGTFSSVPEPATGLLVSLGIAVFAARSASGRRART